MLARGAERNRSHRVERMAASREVFDVTVIAGQNHRNPGKIRRFKDRSNKPAQIDQMLACKISALGVADTIGDEVFV